MSKRDKSPVRPHMSMLRPVPPPGKEKLRVEDTQPRLGEGQSLGSREYYVWKGRVYVQAKYTDQLEIRYDCPFCWKTHTTPAYHNISYRCEDRPCPCLPPGYRGFSIFITRPIPNHIVPEPRGKGVDPYCNYYTRKTD